MASKSGRENVLQLESRFKTRFTANIFWSRTYSRFSSHNVLTESALCRFYEAECCTLLSDNTTIYKAYVEFNASFLWVELVLISMWYRSMNRYYETFYDG